MVYIVNCVKQRIIIYIFSERPIYINLTYDHVYIGFAILNPLIVCMNCVSVGAWVCVRERVYVRVRARVCACESMSVLDVFLFYSYC